jgi:hypothetical protein
MRVGVACLRPTGTRRRQIHVRASEPGTEALSASAGSRLRPPLHRAGLLDRGCCRRVERDGTSYPGSRLARRNAASPSGVPGQCRSTAAAPARRTTERSTRATTIASSAWPSTGTKSGTRSIGIAR